MTTRQFDPVFSAALRNELEALADTRQEAEASKRRLLPALRRPQVWISVVTAAVLVAATVGVLRLTSPPPQPAGESRVLDPLTHVTDPESSGYVARAVLVLLHISARGPGTSDFSVPAGVRSLRVYLNCAPTGHSTVDIDGEGRMSGECSRDTGSTFDFPVEAGTHEVEVAVGKRTDYTLLLMASPAPTVSSGGLIDPLAQVRDRRNPDALVGDTRALYREASTGSAPPVAFQVPGGVTRLRAYLVCTPSSATTELTIGGHVVAGCMNSIAHWFDFRPSTRSVVTGVTDPTGAAWSLLVVPAPNGAKDSPASTTLPYPDSPGTVLGRARGTGAPAEGTYRTSATSIAFTVTCRGTGWLEMTAGASGTTTRGTRCSTLKPNSIGFGGGDRERSLQTWSVVPHGDISWTFQLHTDD